MEKVEPGNQTSFISHSEGPSVPVFFVLFATWPPLAQEAAGARSVIVQSLRNDAHGPRCTGGFLFQCSSTSDPIDLCLFPVGIASPDTDCAAAECQVLGWMRHLLPGPGRCRPGTEAAPGEPVRPGAEGLRRVNHPPAWFPVGWALRSTANRVYRQCSEFG